MFVEVTVSLSLISRDLKTVKHGLVYDKLDQI